MNTKKKVVCYCRVSTSSKDQANSFENQKEFFEKYCQNDTTMTLYKGKNNGNTGIYADRGISGTLLHRENFEKLLWDAGLNCGIYTYTPKVFQDVDSNQYQVKYKAYKIERTGNPPLFEEIIVKNTSRFARNVQVAAILQELRNVGVYVTFLDINKSTRNEADIPIIQFFQQFDEMFSRDLSRKLLAANVQSRENQILRTAYNIYGFEYHKRKNRAENNRLTAVPEEATIIQMIFRMYYGCFLPEYDAPCPMPPCDFKCSECPKRKEIRETDGFGFRWILRLLNEAYGYRTRNGKPFAQSTLKHIFENEKVAGYLNSGKWDHGPMFNKYPSPKIREGYKEYLHYRPDLIDPIISIELFDLCTEKREKKAGESLGKFKGAATKYKGLIYCAHCGEVYTHSSTSGKTKEGIYRCKGKRMHTSSYCKNANVFDAEIEACVERLCNGEINELLITKNLQVLSTLYKRIQENIIKLKQAKNESRIKGLESEIAKRKSGLQKLYERLAVDDADTSLLENTISTSERELKKAIEELDGLTKSPKTLLQEIENQLNLCYTVCESTFQGKKTYSEGELLTSIVEKFVVYGETEKDETNHWKRSEASIVPVLKNEVLLSTKYGIQIDPLAPSILYNMGVEGTLSMEEEVKAKLSDIKSELESLKSLYFTI